MWYDNGRTFLAEWYLSFLDILITNMKVNDIIAFQLHNTYSPVLPLVYDVFNIASKRVKVRARFSGFCKIDFPISYALVDRKSTKPSLLYWPFSWSVGVIIKPTIVLLIGKKYISSGCCALSRYSPSSYANHVSNTVSLLSFIVFIFILAGPVETELSRNVVTGTNVRHESDTQPPQNCPRGSLLQALTTTSRIWAYDHLVSIWLTYLLGFITPFTDAQDQLGAT